MKEAREDLIKERDEQLRAGYKLVGKAIYTGAPTPTKNKAKVVKEKALPKSRDLPAGADLLRALDVTGKRRPIKAADVAAFAKEVSLPLPKTYVMLMTAYGAGEVGGCLRLAGPKGPRGADIRRERKAFADAPDVFAEDLGEPWRERLAAAVPFASTHDGHVFLWERAEKGEPTVLYLPRFGTPLRLSGGFDDLIWRAAVKGDKVLFGKGPPPAKGEYTPA